MKTFVVLLVFVAAASAQFNAAGLNVGIPPPGGRSLGAAAGAGAGAAGAAGGAQQRSLASILGLPEPRNWGNRVWGEGANNPFVNPNPFVMERATAIANKINGLYVRIDDEGDVGFTNAHGFPVKIRTPFGGELELEP